MAKTESQQTVIVTLNAEQATALYDLCCWFLDPDASLADVNHMTAVQPETVKSAASAIIRAGGEGRDYL